MIQNLNFSINNIFGTQKAPQRQAVKLPHKNMTDVFVKTHQNVPAFKGKNYAQDDFDRILGIAYNAEENSDPQAAEPILIKNFRRIERHIVNYSKDLNKQVQPQNPNKTEKPAIKPLIKKDALILRFNEVTLDLAANLCMQKMGSQDPDERKALHSRAETYIQRAINIGTKHFEPKAFKNDKEELEEGLQALKSGNPIVRYIEDQENGGEIALHEFLGFEAEDFRDVEDEESSVAELPQAPEANFEELTAPEAAPKSFEEIMGDSEKENEGGVSFEEPAEADIDKILGNESAEEVFAQNTGIELEEDDDDDAYSQSMPQEKVLADRQIAREVIEKNFPDGVNREGYTFGDSDFIGDYAGLSLMAANNYINEKEQASGSPKAYSIIKDSQKFLNKKDPDELYWSSDDFTLAQRKASEAVGRNNEAAESEEGFNAFMDAQNEDLPVEKRAGNLDKMAKSPFLLGLAVMLDLHETISKVGIDLLARHKSPAATERLQQIAKEHPQDAIKAFATKQLLGLKK